MTNERAAKIVLDFINAGEAEYRNFSVEEIIAFKKAYVALNPEPVTNADRIRAMSDEKLASLFGSTCDCDNACCFIHHEGVSCMNGCEAAWLEWLKKEVD